MFSADCSHSESENYYPDKLNFLKNKPVSASISHNNFKIVNKSGEITSNVNIQDFILSKRSENTLRSIKCDMT